MKTTLVTNIKRLAYQGFTLSAIALTLTACGGNLSNVSPEGTTNNPIFPRIDKSTFDYGKLVGMPADWDNIRKIEAGMSKEHLYHLIGHPHFGEGLYGVREWDYVFSYDENGKRKICQFKVLFDKEMKTQTFLWYPNGCNGNVSFNLSGDFLFDFDKDTLTTKGKEIVDNVAAQLKSSGAQQVKIAGYTDRLGSENYNLQLSQRRANIVKARLAQQGVAAQMESVGYGKANQVKACDGESGQALRDCLRPNRRVEIFANGDVLKQSEGGNVAGPNGPAPLYQTPVYNTGK